MKIRIQRHDNTVFELGKFEDFAIFGGSKTKFASMDRIDTHCAQQRGR